MALQITRLNNIVTSCVIRPSFAHNVFVLSVDKITFEIGVTTSDSIPVLALQLFCLQNPGSMTYIMPLIVRDVSAIFVAKITQIKKKIYNRGNTKNIRAYYRTTFTKLEKCTFRAPGGVGSNILACKSDGRLAYIGAMINSLIFDPRRLLLSCKIIHIFVALNTFPQTLERSNQKSMTFSLHKKCAADSLHNPYWHDGIPCRLSDFKVMRKNSI